MLMCLYIPDESPVCRIPKLEFAIISSGNDEPLIVGPGGVTYGVKLKIVLQEADVSFPNAGS
ncbi:MAG TPA: hypothetical protein VGP83_02950 [Pyrinomonadaceae bacterium]|nr:hypothetical protein [Pyrinomonadaceae bacterium]